MSQPPTVTTIPLPADLTKQRYGQASDEEVEAAWQRLTAHYPKTARGLADLMPTAPRPTSQPIPCTCQTTNEAIRCGVKCCEGRKEDKEQGEGSGERPGQFKRAAQAEHSRCRREPCQP